MPILAVGAALTIAACGDDDESTGSAAQPAAPVTAPAESDEHAAMPTVDSGATLTVAKPAAGDVVTGNTVAADVQLDNFKIDCRFAGTPNQDGIGHYHVMLDGKLIDMFCKDRADVSLQNVAAGEHELEVVPAVNDHTDDLDEEKKIAFTYQPERPLPAIKAVANPGKPEITIVSPKPGTKVSDSFDLVVEPKNLKLSCGLYGKDNIDGYGHWHINVDSTTEGMMGMGTMMGMSCKRSFKVSLAGIPKGEHTFFAIGEDNQHAPTLKTQDSVKLVVQ